MKKFFKIFFIFFLSFSFFGFSLSRTQAQDCDAINCNKDDSTNYTRCLEEKQSCWLGKIGEAQSAAITLKSTINILNGQINVSQLQIDQSLSEINSLEKEVEELSVRIEGLNYSLDKLTSVLVKRVSEHYKRGNVNPFLAIFSKNKFSTLLSEYKYLKLAQQQTATAMERAEAQKISYDEQKELKQEKQQQLEAKRLALERQKNELASKRLAEQSLLTQTKNNEAIFQQKLAEAKAEFQAIQAIIAGKGDETKVGYVDSGAKIATVISGSSCNSSGTHLHFIVAQAGLAQNPFEYLRSGIDYENCSGSSCGSGDGDSFNPSGDWEWPINSKIQLWQGFGSTWAVQNTWVGRLYQSHNGIDIRSLSSHDVKSIKGGDLYRGSYTGSGGCRLRYVRVSHQDSNISSFYLHVNY